MGILAKLNLKNLKLNKKRNIVTTIGIILSVALITCVTTMFTSVKETTRLAIANAEGDYHFSTNRVSLFDKIIQDRNIDHHFIVKRLTPDIKESKDPSSVTPTQSSAILKTVYTINSSQLKTAGIKITSGEAPKNPNEAIISVNFHDRDSEKYKIGATIKVSSLNDKEYKIVGFYETRSYIFGSPYGEVLSLITTPLPNQKSEVANTSLYYALKNPASADSHKREFYGDISSESAKTEGGLRTVNSYLLNIEGVNLADGTMVVLLIIAAFVIAIIMLTSIFVIKNSFSISATERIKEFGILKSLGATTKQIKSLIMLEGYILGSVGIILGVGLGILANYILINIVNLLMQDFISADSKLVVKISFLGIIVAILTGIITIYLSIFFIARRAKKISAIEAIRSSEDIKIKDKSLKTPKFISKIFGIGGVISYKNLKRNRKKYRTTVISLIISVVSFISINYIVSSIFVIAGNTLRNVNYNYGLTFNGRTDQDFSNYVSVARQISKNIIKNPDTTILTANEVVKIPIEDFSKDAQAFFRQHGFIAYSQDGEDGKTKDFVLVMLSFLDDESFEYILKKNHLSSSTKVIAPDFITISDKKTSIVTTPFTSDKINFRNVNYINADGTKNTENFTANIAKIKEMPLGFNKNVSTQGGYLKIITRASNPDYQSLKNSQSVFVFASVKNVKEAEKSTAEFLTQQKIDKRNYYQMGEAIRVMYNMMLIVQIFGYGFIAVITLIGLTNVFNTIHTSMLLRRREFAALRSIGVTKKELNRIVALESLFYGLKSLSVGIIIGVAITLAFHSLISSKEPIPYYPPFAAIFISIAFIFLVVYIIMQYSIRSANKQNVIETIRNENI